ncbi:hypothetical protein B0H19DRAFT_1337824, partial [Mycena capillaripes]
TRHWDVKTVPYYHVRISISNLALRNERVIQEKAPASQVEIQNQWLKVINDRLGLDRLLTNSRYRSTLIPISVLSRTWHKVLQNEDQLPKDWIRKAGVLVG